MPQDRCGISWSQKGVFLLASKLHVDIRRVVADINARAVERREMRVRMEVRGKVCIKMYIYYN